MSESETSTAKPTELQKVTDKFIAEIQSKGIVHAFEWIQGHMDAVARALLLDEIDRDYSNFPTKALKAEARTLYLKEILTRGIEGVTNYSTSIGHNYMKQARIAESARLLNNNYTESAALRQRWDDLFAKSKALTEDRAEAAASTETVSG